jgi:hypothetical protein
MEQDKNLLENEKPTEKQYEDVEQTFWNPEKEGDSIEGIYLSKQEEVGENKATVYNIETPEKQVIGVWGSTVIDQKMKLISSGDDIRIIFEGRVKPEKGKEYKSFKIQRAKKN